MIRFDMRGKAFIFWAAVIAALVLAPFPRFSQVSAASVKLSPYLAVKYTVNDNIDSVDTSDIKDPAHASYMNYILGLGLSYVQGRHELNLSGRVAYQQYLVMEGRVEDAADTSPEDYNFMRLRAALAYHYRARTVNFSLSNTITQNRDLQDVFNEGTDTLNYRYLYTHNLARAALRFRPSGKSRIYLAYTYDTLVFTDSENEWLEDRYSKPPDSVEHRGLLRSEYDFTGRTTGIVDLQVADRTFENVDDLRSADYTLYQGMLGLRYHFNSQTSLTGLGGVAHREFRDLSRFTLPSPPYDADTLAYDLSDTTEPVGMIILDHLSPGGLDLSLRGERGVSIYGRNLFYTHTSVHLLLKYPFTSQVGVRLSGRYQHAVFDADDNGRDWQWSDDRVDQIIVGNASLYYHILMKGGQPTLSVEGGYIYRSRDSSLDRASDYTDEYRTLTGIDDGVRSYDSVVQIYYVQVVFHPSIRLSR